MSDKYVMNIKQVSSLNVLTVDVSGLFDTDYKIQVWPDKVNSVLVGIIANYILLTLKSYSVFIHFLLCCFFFAFPHDAVTCL
jgi:hypothetical protein